MRGPSRGYLLVERKSEKLSGSAIVAIAIDAETRDRATRPTNAHRPEGSEASSITPPLPADGDVVITVPASDGIGDLVEDYVRSYVQ